MYRGFLCLLEVLLGKGFLCSSSGVEEGVDAGEEFGSGICYICGNISFITVNCKIQLSHCSLFLAQGQASDIGSVVAFEGLLVKSCLFYLQQAY